MPSKIKARLTKHEGEYYLELPNNKPRKIDQAEAMQFLLSFHNSEYLTPGDSRIVARAKGEVLAKLLDTGSLVVTSPDVLSEIFSPDVHYLTVAEYSALYNKKSNIIARFCRDGRIPGAIQREHRWLIPEGAPYPKHGLLKDSDSNG